MTREFTVFEPDALWSYWNEDDEEICTDEADPWACATCSCKLCGFSMLSEDPDTGWFDHEKGEQGGLIMKARFNYCPNCGARVVK